MISDNTRNSEIKTSLLELDIYIRRSVLDIFAKIQNVP